MTSDVLTDAVMAEAEAAYEREDQAWFNALPTETLAAMWKLCCDIETMPSWDDEVYDALYPRGYFAVAKPDPSYVPGAVYPPISDGRRRITMRSAPAASLTNPDQRGSAMFVFNKQTGTWSREGVVA